MVFEPSPERQVAICQVIKKRKAILSSKSLRTKPHKLEIARHVPGNASSWLKHKVPGRACPELKMLKGLIPHTRALKFHPINKEKLLNSFDL